MSMGLAQPLGLVVVPPVSQEAVHAAQCAKLFQPAFLVLAGNVGLWRSHGLCLLSAWSHCRSHSHSRQLRRWH